MISDMEAINMQSWNATETHQYAGWHLRLSGGYSRRANSVFTHAYDDSMSLNKAIDHCEAIYNAQDLPVIFRLTDATQPTGLEQTLEKRAYGKEAPSIVKTMDLTSLDTNAHPEFTVSNHFEDTWLADYMQFNNIAPHLYNSHKGIISAMSDCAYGRIGDSARGLAVKVGDWVAFYDIVVNPEKRGQGYGKFLMQSLIKHAQSIGAKQGILSVDATNAPAIRLYDSLGFQTRYNYWYYRQANGK